LTTKSWRVFYLAAEIILLSIILSKFFGCGFAALGKFVSVRGSLISVFRVKYFLKRVA